MFFHIKYILKKISKTILKALSLAPANLTIIVKKTKSLKFNIYNLMLFFNKQKSILKTFLS